MILTAEQKMIQETARQFSEFHLKTHSAAWDKNHTFPINAIQQMAPLGFMGMLVPEEWGGSQIGYLGYALVIEEIAYGDGSTSTILSVHNSVVSGTLVRFGSDLQKEKFLKPLAKGEMLGAFCLSESQAGSDALNLETKAELRNDGYILNGTKQFITSGKHADVAIVFAVTDKKSEKKGISAFIVPTKTKGYRVGRMEEKMGQHAAETVQISLEDVIVPLENRLGDPGAGYKIALSQLESGRIGIAAQSIGMARSAYDHAVNFAKERITFGKPIIEHQAIAFKLADMATQIEAARQLVHHAAMLEDQGIKCTKEAAMAKLFASEMAERVCREAIQIHGGYGYLQDFPVEQIYRDVRVAMLYEGTSEIQRLLISRLL